MLDIVGIMLHVIITKGLDPQRRNRLVERLRNYAAQVFLDIGEDLDKVLGYFENMSEQEFWQAMPLSNFLNWIRYEITGKFPGN